MRKFSLVALLLTVLAALSVQSFAACHAVGPTATGNGSGSDWNNRMNKLPATLVRGDTYYLMDGSYGQYNFTTSGTSVITVKKAQSYDYGRASDGCPNDISAGWNASTMGASQAVFTFIGNNQLNGISYITIDGNGRWSGVGCGTSPMANQPASDCGIKLTSTKSSGNAMWLGTSSSGGNRMVGWNLRYVEWQGGGDNPTDEQNGIYCPGGCDSLLMEHLWWHESGTDFFKIPFANGVTLRYSHVKQNYDSSTFHGQMWMSEGGVNNLNIYSNLFQDIQGTAWFTFNSGGTATNINIYNNIFLRTPGSTRGSTSNGIIACINSHTCGGPVQFIGNTVVNATADYSNQGLGINNENAGGHYVWQNNLFYGAQCSAVGFNMAGTGTTLTEDHNSYLNCGTPGTRSGAGDLVVTSGSPNPFTNWTGYDFTLTANNANWSNGLALASPFNVDLAGALRPGSSGTWNRGALQYSSSVAQLPAPPTSVTVTVQ
jgi:hypothetical protein